MITVEREDWLEMIQMVKEAAEVVSLPAETGDKNEKVRRSRQALQALHTTAAMLGMGELERAGVELEQYLADKVAPNNGEGPEAVATFGFAVNALLESMKKAEIGSEATSIRASEVIGILETGHSGSNAPENAVEPLCNWENEEEENILDAIVEGHPTPPSRNLIDFKRLQSAAESLGGNIIISPSNGRQDGTFSIHFQATPAIVERIEGLLSSRISIDSLADELSSNDGRTENVLGTIKEFMAAMASSDVNKAQDILLRLSEQQKNVGMYKEIGVLARDLHNSLRNFIDSMDPALKEIVEDKIPDSGNRLEHILELTEKAATTTLDQVEAMQKRNGKGLEGINRLKEILDGLRAVGGQAQNRISEGRGILDALQTAAEENHNALITILTAQDYQDLTGQVILKIIKLLNDLELKLVDLIRTFGVRVDDRKKSPTEDLYGPAHKGVSEALHSQDDVDSLLASFGF